MSRNGLLLIALIPPSLAVGAAPVRAQDDVTLSAEEAMERYRQKFTAAGRQPADCAPAGGSDEIVICGRRPVPREVFADEPGTRVALQPGEPPRPSAGASGCCGAGGGLDVFKVVGALRKGIGALLGDDK